jgi:hypothetical protein
VVKPTQKSGKASEWRSIDPELRGQGQVKSKQKPRTKPGFNGKSDHDRISSNGQSKSEFDDDRILMLPLADLIPAKVNEKVYKPVDPNDPDVRELGRSISENGLLVPIEVSLDNVILSGHRRRVGCQLAGLEEVPCRRVNVRSTDP